ncbi:MAG TPA: HEPN domain-containing protein [Mucilaginibacter sp.]|jgi:HEPN domain-containing protein/predicted nucleotidyltransferase
MKTSLEHLPPEKQQLLKEITNAIVDKVGPEKVMLFGSYATDKWVEDEYEEEGRLFEYRSDYDILVVTKEGEQRPDYEVEEIAEYRTGLRDIVSIITHDITYVNGKLSDGQYFFSDIQKEGILLYDAGNMPLAEKRELTSVEKAQMAKRDFDLWFTSAAEFMEGVLFYFQKGILKKAAFLLHQAAEHTYNAVILVFRGYKPKTHNLRKLYKYTKHYSIKLAGVFPQHTQEERDLFILLKKGYVEARYDKDYVITEALVKELIKRIQALQATAEIICSEKIASFESL